MQRLLKFGQSGEISENLGTLFHTNSRNKAKILS